MARPRQQRMDPRRVEEAVTGSGSETAPARKSSQTPKKGAPTPKRDGTLAKKAPVRGATSAAARAAASAPAATKAPSGASGHRRPAGSQRSGSPAPRRATAGDWIAGARLRTLPLAVLPVALGTGTAALVLDQPWQHWVRALVCLGIALALQIGVNYANDYSDGIRGTDADRQGPMRLVGSGRAPARQVLTVAIVFFAIAAVGGVFLAVRTEQWWLLAVGAVCIAAAWFYTGGKRPYGYAALGEVAVFVFFGLVATVGTTFVQTVGTKGFSIHLETWLAAVASGCLACAVLLVNNLRDRTRDRAAGKRTLTVLIGDLPSRILYALLLLAPFGILALFTVLYPVTGFVYFALITALPAAVIVILARSARELITALQLTTLTALLYGLGLGAALVAGALAGA